MLQREFFLLVFFAFLSPPVAERVCSNNCWHLERRAVLAYGLPGDHTKGFSFFRRPQHSSHTTHISCISMGHFVQGGLSWAWQWCPLRFDTPAPRVPAQGAPGAASLPPGTGIRMEWAAHPGFPGWTSLSHSVLRKDPDRVFSPFTKNVNIHEMGANCLNFL